MTIQVKVEGLKELIKNFKELRVREELNEAVNKSIVQIHRRALVEVPVRSSQLQKSHIISPSTASRLSGEVYTNLEYAVPVHQGHRLVAWGRDTGRKIPPNPWMERAINKESNSVQKFFDEALENISNQLTR